MCIDRLCLSSCPIPVADSVFVMCQLVVVVVTWEPPCSLFRMGCHQIYIVLESLFFLLLDLRDFRVI